MNKHILKIDPKEIFGHDPDNYDHARVGYKPEFVAQMLFAMRGEATGGAAKQSCHVVDVGAGTGKLGEQFLNLGCRVTFVEPNKHLAAYLRKQYGQKAEASIVEASAESTGLPDKQADIIVMGDAAHWIAPSALPELRRILKPQGQIALFARFWSQESPLTDKVHELLLTECPEYVESTTQLKRDVENMRKRHGKHLVTEEQNFWHGYSFVKPYTREDLKDYFKSCSFSAPAIERDEVSFDKKVIDPLWKFAKKEGFVTKQGEMNVPYEINVLYGAPRQRLKTQNAETGRSKG